MALPVVIQGRLTIASLPHRAYFRLQYTDSVLHSANDVPSLVLLKATIWHCRGKPHRGNDKPAVVYNGGEAVLWFDHGVAYTPKRYVRPATGDPLCSAWIFVTGFENRIRSSKFMIWKGVYAYIDTLSCELVCRDPVRFVHTAACTARQHISCRSLAYFDLGDVVHYNDLGLIHKDDGPAVVRGGTKEWWDVGSRVPLGEIDKHFPQPHYSHQIHDYRSVHGGYAIAFSTANVVNKERIYGQLYDEDGDDAFDDDEYYAEYFEQYGHY